MLALAAIYGRVWHIKQASLILPKGKNMSYEQFYSQAIQAPRDKAREAASASSEYDAAVKELPKCALCGKVLVINLFGPIKLCCKG